MTHTWKLLFIMVVLKSTLFCQMLSPTELETAQLAKLKAQHEVKQGELNQIDLQLRLLQLMRQITQADEQSKLSQVQGKAQEIIKAHKWEADYKLDQTETGTFVTKPTEKK